MFNLKGIVAGSLAYVVVEIALLYRALPSRPAASGTGSSIGYDVLTMVHLVGVNEPMFWVGVLVFASMASRFFQK